MIDPHPLTCFQLETTMGHFNVVCNEASIVADLGYFDPAKEFALTTQIDCTVEYGKVPKAGALGNVYLIDSAAADPSIHFGSNCLTVIAPLRQWERMVTNRQYTLLGNQGVVFRYMLVCLEDMRQIHSFHATALYAPRSNHLIIGLGRSGSGKSVMLLEGLAKGLQVFATELVHFSTEGGKLVFYRGSCSDNIWVHNLVHDFSNVADGLVDMELVRALPMDSKIALNLRSLHSERVIVSEPTITLVFPRLESNRTTLAVNVLNDLQAVRLALFQNASEKIATPQILYDTFVVPSQDTLSRSQARWKSLLAWPLGSGSATKRIVSLWGGTKDCLSWLVDV